jgi:hypothetical protein
MKKILLAGVAGCALFIVNSASADVNVLANITKTKDITVTETVTITKTVNLEAVVGSVPGKAAESTGIINQSNYNNLDCGNCAEKNDTISNSIGGGTDGGNHGIVNVNQASGNMNNQGNAVSVAWDFDTSPGPVPVPPVVPPPTPGTVGNSSFANSQAHVDQKNGAYNLTNPSTGAFTGISTAANTVDAVNLLFRDAAITNSINHNTGIVNVNQAVGNNSNQANNESLAVSLLPGPTGTPPVGTETGGVALSEADLGQLNTGNHNWESDATGVAGDEIFGIHKSATMTDSVSDNIGIVGVNQSAGNMSNQANNVSAAFVVVGGSF